jgi:O-Antigen ligase
VVAIDRVGIVAALLPAAALVAAYLIDQPRVALATLLGATVVIEADPVGLLPIGPSFYQPIRLGLTPTDVLLGLVVVGTALELIRTRSHPRGIGPMTLPLLALAGAYVAGVATGFFGGASPNELFLSSVRMAHLLILPFVCVNLLRSNGEIRAFLAGAAGLAAYKAVTGLLAVAGGAGLAVEGATITYYEPLANWLILIFLLGVLAARIRHVPVPAWAYWTVPVALGAFLLSYRRSFWLGAVFAIVLVGIVASRRRSRAVLAVGAAGLLLVIVGTFTLGRSSDVQSPVLERARSLEPGRLTESSGDRYRLDEQRNVVDDLRRHPVTGLGMNVEWTARHPLSEEHDRNYVHVVLLWYWLKLGVLGVIGFLWLYAMALWTAFRVWGRHRDPLVRIGVLAAGGGLAALAIVELTASFTGVDARLTTAFGALLGWIAACWQGLPHGSSARATASTE